MTDRKVTLITGASYGVGAATALALAHNGFDLALTATREENLAATCGELKKVGAEPLALVLDLRAQESIEAAVAKTIDNFGRIDVLVINAGTNLRRKAIEITSAEWNALMTINATGTFS